MPSGPNLVLFSVDTLRPDHTGSYGYARDTTPHLDAFFSEGTVFETVWASAPCTLPSVPQLLMGSYEIAGGRPLLAETLRDHGYATGAVVSQHQFDPTLHKRPEQRTRAELVRRGFQDFDLQSPSEIASRLSTRTARSVTRGGLAWLAEHAGDEPFFLWLHYFDPHNPYEPPAEFRGFDAGNTSTRGGDLRRYLKLEKRTPKERWQLAGYVFDDADVDHFVNLYDGEIRFTDSEIGKVLAALEAGDLVDDTVVVLVSDHGEFLGEGGRWDHCLSLREPEVRVPLMIRDRGGPVGGAHRISVPASTLDVVPTVLALLGIDPPPDGFDGVDLRTAGPRPLFSASGDSAGVRKDGWKLVNGSGAALYDLSSEEGEARDRRGEQPEQGAKLASELDLFLKANPGLIDQNQEVFEQLREIGYIE